jgi:hypothetical protein
MSVVASAVDTVIVCFAEAPAELQLNHPHLSNQMVQAWRLVYPEEFVYAVPTDDNDNEGVYNAPTNQTQQIPLIPSSSITAPDKTDPLAPPRQD